MRIISTRRQFLIGLALVFAVSFRRSRSSGTTRGELLPARLKRVIVFDSNSASAIFGAFLEQAPAERDLKHLVSSVIGEDAAWPASIESLSDAQLRHRIMQRIRDDFGCGNTVQLDGWVLSRTEARLCGIIALA